MQTTKELANLRFDLVRDGSRWVVAIYIDNAFWDFREFDSEADARQFFNDPLADDRAKSHQIFKPEVIDTRFLDSVGIREIYRRIA